LDHFDPAADTLYKAGQELYRNRYWAVAVGPLRQAIGLNPHHLGANLLLADILLKDKNANEACEILEKLYTVRPSAAQTPLIQALLALAQSNNSEDEQLKLYERILKIDPIHPEAKRQKQEILKRREAEKQRRIKTIKGIYDKYSKRIWEFLGFSFALVVSYYLLTEFREIPWYWVGTLLGAFWILLIEIVYAVKKRGVAPDPY
jgi:tetratricopeptide (TPR) repeat protein